MREWRLRAVSMRTRDTARSGVPAERGDHSRVPGCLQPSGQRGLPRAIDPDVEWHPPPDIDAPIANGRDALAAQWRDWLSAWEEYRFVPDEIVEGRGDAVLVSGEESARGKGSGIEVRSRRVTAVYELRAGRIVRFKAYLDRAEARQAAGPHE